MYKIKYLLLAILCSLAVIACKPSAEKSKAKKVKTTKVAKKKRAKKANPLWGAAQKELNLTSDQTKRLKAITAKYNKQINGLKKAKNWDGKKNASNRKKLVSARSAELKKTLGSKYKAYMAFLKKWSKKQKAARKSKKKAKTKKK